MSTEVCQLCSRRVGYSLIELLVAMALFAIAALGLSVGVAIVSRAGVLSDHFTRATILAQDKLEELAARGGAPAEGADAPAPGFSRSWTVALDDPEIGESRVNVTVSWEGADSRTIALTTVMND
jgi:prepilin-type N-terminal cleavage/methylation domain-containing protein